MKVAILGNGFVGNATRYYLEKYCPNVKEILIEDPAQGLHIDNWKGVVFTFICVPTDLDGGDDKLDTRIVGQALKRSKGIPVIRSTIGVDQVTLLALGYDKDFLLWPEFLRENHWEDDVNNFDIPIVLGGRDDNRSLLIDSILTNDNKIIFEGSCHEAALMKMSRNAMLAAKVAQANMLYGLCEEYKASYDLVKAFLIEDGTLGVTHFEVPGPDGNLGFGGKCLPKDTTHYMNLFSEDNLYEDVLKYKRNETV
mgnify:CR=1 FL=1